MPLLLQIEPSNRKGKKWKANFVEPDGTVASSTHFGDSNYQDYTQHGDLKRKTSYLLRHQGEDWDNFRTAGSLSRHILWGASTDFRTNVRLFKKKFKLV